MVPWAECSNPSRKGTLPRRRPMRLLSVCAAAALVPVTGKLVQVHPKSELETVRAWADDLPRYSASQHVGGGLRGRSLSMSSLNSSLHSSSLALNNSSAGYDPSNTEENPTRVVFLFLTRNGWNNGDLWDAFFDKVPKDQYQIYMHCSASCDGFISAHSNLHIKKVATVPTSYCSNLMTAMVHLLDAALPENTAANTKLVYLSESTLPVKPFKYIYKELTMDSKSDFCVQKPLEWTQGANCQVVKHSQWVVLNPAHAQLVVSNWPQIQSRFKDHRYTLPLMDPTTGEIDGERSVPESRLCTDEWGILASIWGAIPNGASVSDSSMNPSALDRKATGAQGKCRTFAFWSAPKSDPSALNLVREMRHAWPQTRMQCSEVDQGLWEIPDCGGLTHPVTISKVDDKGARIMRNSDFLFMRKFKPGVFSIETFKSQILRILL